MERGVHQCMSETFTCTYNVQFAPARGAGYCRRYVVAGVTLVAVAQRKCVLVGGACFIFSPFAAAAAAAAIIQN